MPHYDTHCAICLKELGHPFGKVHHYLDAYFGKSAYPGLTHRRMRHHQAGVNEVKRIFGEQAGRAAYLHIVADLKQLGWTEGVDPFPVDEQSYIDLERFLLLRLKEKPLPLWWE